MDFYIVRGDVDCTIHLIVDDTKLEYQYQIISITSNILKIKGPFGIYRYL
jgi:hypothetical protein